MFKDFEVIDYVASNLQREVRNASSEFDKSSPINHIAELLRCHGCKSIVIEREYVDKDFTSEFSEFYSKRFSTPPGRCKRLHFFSEKPKNTKVIDIGNAAQDSYLGYMVVRPTEFNRIGRTVIRQVSPNAAVSSKAVQKGVINSKSYVTCVTSYPAHILGERFEVSGMPFIQQDTEVGVCAHAALWMVGRYLSACGVCHEFLPAGISRLAKVHQARGRTFPADGGLTTSQMLDAIQGMGLSAIHYDAKYLNGACKHLDNFNIPDSDQLTSDTCERILNGVKLADIAYRYVESRLPVIFLKPDHAVVGVGHTLACNSGYDNNIQRIPGFIVNDDSVGPYVNLPIIGYERDSFSKCVEGIIVITPSAATLAGSHAEEGAVSTILKLRQLTEPENPIHRKLEALANLKYRIRTYLLRSTEFQKDLRDESRESKGEEIISKLLRLDYPQFIWVSELYEPETNHCVGKVIVDSTAAKGDRMTMAVLLKDVAFLTNRRNPEETYFSTLPRAFRCKPKEIAAAC